MKETTTKVLSAEEKKELEIKELKARLAELDPDFKLQRKSVKIPLDEYIPVMSLLPYRLMLSTKEGGTGDVKKFTKFGEVKQILYRDLIDIIEVQRSFMEAGYFYILNPEVIRQHGLDDVYSKILTKDKIEEIFNNANPEDCIELYNSANPEQQKVIVQLFVDKLKDNPDSVNMNTVSVIERLSNIRITEKAKDAKALEQELVEQNQ